MNRSRLVTLSNMTGEKEDKGQCKGIKAGVFITAALLVLLSSVNTASAAIGTKISSALSSYAANPQPGFFDLLVFTVIFFSICWISFSKVFSDAKNAVIALSVALGIGFGISLVYGAKFTVKSLLPFAGMILFLVGVLGLYVLLTKIVFTKDTIASRILSFIIALIVAFLLVALLWNMICSGNTCENNLFMRKVFGSESFMGKIFGGATGALTGIPYYNYPQTEAGPDTTLQPAKRNEESATDIWNYAGLGAIGLIVFLLLLKFRNTKSGLSNLWVWRKEKRQRKKAVEILQNVEDEEKRINQEFRSLCESVKNEKRVHDIGRELVDRIVMNIKETIGEEQELIKNTKDEQGDTLTKHIEQLVRFNQETHQDMIKKIVSDMNSQLTKLKNIPQELKNELDGLENMDSLFRKNSELLRTFKQHNFREKEAITGMIRKIEENMAGFRTLSEGCDRIGNIIKPMQDHLKTIEEGNDRKFDETIKGMYENWKRLRIIFRWKLQTMQHLVDRMKEVKAFIHDINDNRRMTTEDLLNTAHRMYNAGEFKDAMKLAMNVKESAESLLETELKPESFEALNRMKSDAEQLINNCAGLVNRAEEIQKPKIGQERAENQEQAGSHDIPPGLHEMIKGKDFTDRLKDDLKKNRFSSEQIEQMSIFADDKNQNAWIMDNVSGKPIGKLMLQEQMPGSKDRTDIPDDRPDRWNPIKNQENRNPLLKKPMDPMNEKMISPGNFDSSEEKIPKPIVPKSKSDDIEVFNKIPDNIDLSGIGKSKNKKEPQQITSRPVFPKEKLFKK